VLATAEIVTTLDDRERAFASLVAAEHDRAVALAYHLVGGDRELARDVAQEAFVRAYRALPGFRGEAQLSTWLLRIVINEAASARRREKVRRFLGLTPSHTGDDEIPRPDPGVGPEAAAHGQALKQRIAFALDRLSEGQRTAFALVHLEGLTVERAAVVLGRAPGTVKSHLHRALATLRRELADLVEE
jgi:RNA polymerase sigma-70 factor (ECF subfamily)